jgi:hypothetical protein
MGVDALDIVAIILGVLFTIRKLDAQRRTRKEVPHVNPEDFSRWQRLEVSVYSAAIFACFAKVFVDWGFVYFLADGLSVGTVRAIGATIDLSWVLVVIVTFFRTMRLSKMRQELRIVLGGFMVSSGSELSTELKAALRSLEDGDLDRAVYELQQITLDGDESMKGIALYWLGECHLRRGDEQAARAAFQESLEVDPSLQQPRDALSRLDPT